MTGDVFGRELQRLRDVQVAEAVAAERERCIRLLLCPWLEALQCIPDGVVHGEGVVYDGAKVRERLHAALHAVCEGVAAPAEAAWVRSA